MKCSWASVNCIVLTTLYVVYSLHSICNQDLFNLYTPKMPNINIVNLYARVICRSFFISYKYGTHNDLEGLI